MGQSIERLASLLHHYAANLAKKTADGSLLSCLEYQVEWRLSRPAKAMEAAG